MKLVKLMGCCILICFLAGCSAQSYEDAGQVEKMTLDELKENKNQELSKIQNLEFDNLTFQHVDDFRVPDEIGKYKVMIIDHFEDKAEELFEKYIPESVYQKGNITDGGEYYPVGPDFNDPESGLHVGVGCIGFFNYFRDSNSSIVDIIGNDALEEYSLLCEKEKMDTGENGENNNTIEIVTRVENFVDDFCSTTSYPDDLEPVMIAIHKDENGEKIYQSDLRFIFKDTPVNYMGCKLPGDEEQEIPYFPAATCYLNKDFEIEYFCVQCAFEEKDTIEKYQEIITPSQAAQILSEKLSDYRKYNVKGMELVYCPKRIKDVDNKEQNEMHRKNAGWALACSYDEWEFIPCWAFYFSTISQKEMYGLVDVKTGEAVYIEN